MPGAKDKDKVEWDVLAIFCDDGTESTSMGVCRREMLGFYCLHNWMTSNATAAKWSPLETAT